MVNWHRFWAYASLCVILGTFPTWAQNSGKDPLILNMVWRAQLGVDDYMDTLSRIEYDLYPGSGLAYYLPGESGSGYLDVWRHHSNTTGQTVPSNFNPIAGNTLDGRLGYAFPSAESAPGGLTQLARLRNTSTGDRFLALPAETRTGYQTESMNGYAWARNLTNNENLLSLTSGSITIQSNLNTGGALWRWTQNGKQYLSTRDYGRQIQSAFIAQNSLFNNKVINPTEGGSHYSDLSRPVPLRQGSPVIAAYNLPDGKTQLTRSAPLEWSPELFGGDENHPVYWQNTVLGKNITLNYQNRGAVSKYETVLRVPYDAPTGAVEIPTGYLRGEFNRYWTYDAQHLSLSEVNPPNGTQAPYNVQYTPASGFGGVIISSQDQQYAMGVYGTTVNVGGSVDYFTLWDFTSLGGTGEADGGTSKFAAVYGPDGAFGRTGSPTLKAGFEYTFTTWLMSGTLLEVTQQMDNLFSDGVHGGVQSQVLPEPAIGLMLTFGAFALVSRGRRKSALA